jgi:GNAT superfamily N-acetyltransferase
MTVPGVAFRLLAGGQVASEAAGREEDLLALAGDSRRPAGDPTDLARQLRVWRRQPGFALAEALHGGYLVGYAMGMPLRPSTSWWKDLTSPLPDDLTSERPGRTFAVTALLVRAAWRRQGIGTGLLRVLLSGRPEERATLTAAPRATAAQRALRAWGWTKVARTRTAAGEVEDVFILSSVPS